MTTNLNSYGYNFQIKVLASLISDKIFYRRISDILKDDYFESEANRFLFKVIKETYEKYSIPPSKDIFKIYVQNINNDDVLQLNVIEHLKEVIQVVGESDLDAIKDEILKFCKNQELKKAIEDSIAYLELGQFDEIRTRIEGASRVGDEVFSFYDYIAEFANRYSEEARHPIATSWAPINEITQGGLSGGELGVIVASAGGGKSWGLINIGGTAAKAGKTVFHFTLENYQNYTGQRYDAFLSGIAFENLRFNIEDIKTAVSKLPGRLFIEYAPSGTLTINMIKAYIDKAAVNGIKPDLIIVDYADLMRSSIKSAKAELRHMLNNIYVELRGVAGIYNIPIWTASQANRSSVNSDIIQANQVSEDYSKIMTADIVISLQRKLTDKLSSTGSWHFIKNRFGPDGLTFPSKIAFGTGYIQIFEPNSLQGKEITKIQQNGEEIIRKTALSRYKEINNGAGVKKLTKFN